MYQTPWTKKHPTSSLTSDRLQSKPAKSSLSASSKSKKAQGGSADDALPQSKAIRTLTTLRSSLHESSTSSMMDPKGGCFCQARMHPLSTYIPMCPSCALPLCNLVAPAYLCPSCSEPLLSSAQRKALIARIDSEIAETALKELRARERAEEERRAAAGAFPSLLSTSSPSTPPYPTPSPSPKPVQPAPQAQTHKVLSLSSKSKKAVLTTTTVKPSSVTSTPATSRPSSPQPTRVPRPTDAAGARAADGGSVLFMRKERPFENFEVESLIYVPPARVGDDGSEKTGEGRGGGRRQGKTKQKALKNDGSANENNTAGPSSVGKTVGGS